MVTFHVVEHPQDRLLPVFPFIVVAVHLSVSFFLGLEVNPRKYTNSYVIEKIFDPGDSLQVNK